MKNWFPFTDYEFYAYLTSGMLLIAAVDYTLTGGGLVNRTEWTVVASIFWGAIAYLTGQILAIPSAAILEHLLARRLLRPPVTVILELSPRRFRERAVAGLCGIREYQPMPAAVGNKIREKVAGALGIEVDQVTDPEAVFQVAFPYARSVPDCASRLDSFINQYGFCRNIAFAALVSASLLSWQLVKMPTPHTGWLLTGALVLAIGLFLRFLKFYAAYSAEVLRTFNKVVA